MYSVTHYVIWSQYHKDESSSSSSPEDMDEREIHEQQAATTALLLGLSVLATVAQMISSQHLKSTAFRHRGANGSGGGLTGPGVGLLGGVVVVDAD